MDFQKLLLTAQKKQEEVAKKSQDIKRINTNFTTPAKKEQKTKSERPKSEALQKLIDEKEMEKRQRREAEEKERRRRERAAQEREKEEKRSNSFRIPKKTANEDPPSGSESFSSISSDDDNATANHSSHNKSQKHSEHSDKSHKSSSMEHSSNKDRHPQKSSEHSSSRSSKHSGEHSTKRSDHSSSKSDKSKNHTSEKRDSSSSKSHKSSDRDKSRSNGSHSSSSKHKHSDSKSHSKSSSKDKSYSEDSPSHKSHHHTSHKHEHENNKSISSHTAEHNSSGYVTSPDISSEEEEVEETQPDTHPDTDSRLPSNKSRTSSSTYKQEESNNVPVTLTRHHLKPTIDRQGCTLDERNQVLAKLQAIKEKMASNDPGPGRKRAAWGDVKKRRAKREKLDGDFTGSCMEKIDYDEEEKPSLKRPEPKPEEVKPAKENKVRKREKYRPEKERSKKSEKDSRKSFSKELGKSNRFDDMHEKKPKIKPKPAPRPPPVSFADLMKMAAQKQNEPVMVQVAPKKEKEKRPMTQEEIDRKKAVDERFKDKDYKNWYKYGSAANANKNSSSVNNKESSDKSDSGGFLKSNHNVVSSEKSASQSKSFSIPRKSDSNSALKPDKPSSSVSHSSSVKPQPHPMRPGMIANKPHAMAQHIENEGSSKSKDEREEKHKTQSAARDSSPPSRPHSSSSSAAVDKTRTGNAWDSLFSRPEYKKMKEPPAHKRKKMVVESEEEDDYDDDMDDFIDDEGEEDLNPVSSMIQKMFGYDRRKFRDEDEDDRSMEVGFSQVMKEEARSARLGLKEDLEDIRREQEELRQKALKKKMRKH